MVRKAAGSPDSSGIPGGVLPDGGGLPAFTLSPPRAATIPVLIAVPHAGRAYPAPLLAAMRHPQQAPLRLEDRLADLLAARVAQASGAALLAAHAPRALIDLNRAPEDMDWEMVAGAPPAGTPRLAAGRRARSGLGLVPRRLQGLGELWRAQLPAAELEARIDLVHRPYHRALGQALEELRDRWGAALLLDLHSMPPLGPKTGRDPAPDFVTGDRYGSSCAAGLTLAAGDHFARNGWRAAHNRPYAGGYVLDRHGAPQRRIHALQVEVCRAAYLDPALSQPGDGLEAVVDVLTGLVRRLVDELAGPAQALAAE
ncbi:N-formylglutamate amidohydrolase [Alteraurantiacibacter buctensis]|uniref:N-formylglutamate amidohydrolase n=1 Tax=Alteraurantiacibacter buctensis TaxID=1503981 RepID=A0A844YWY7_9SPHN|nr:N-formylglutamate amidohydrolase [Alteraurantiacibacter buctensis]MXO71488.1 N-formylglutamate amidohydrolase [Alteraurantiacibacter buctensis]